MIDPLSFALGSAFGILTLVSWTIVLRDRVSRWRRYRDRRASRDLAFHIPLWAVSVGLCIGMFVAVIRDVADAGTVVLLGLIGIICGLYAYAGVSEALRTRSR